MDGNESSDDDFRLIGDRNWSKIKAASHSEGYRNGIEEGKERKVQVGFDKGFVDGFQQSKSTAEVRGFLSAIMLKEHNTNPQLHDKLKFLIEKI